ncbi:MAG: hypothetical protein JOZ90_09800 [Alphaproteobacteria bacterium]|nr:hypothetical protein [Alphaproteobacteria bacterium]MBV9372397.1 hypothetical protein [Alphaproteobacteria bacterium]MBV9901377.1 hypothetical protein [Alphaproteobacteria bacterium]
MKRLTLTFVLAAGSALLDGGLAQAAAAPERGAAVSADARRLGELKATARAAEERINASADARAALRAARDADQARAVLLRNGFTPEQLRGVAVKLQPGGGKAQARRIEITIRCCPLEIIIRF